MYASHPQEAAVIPTAHPVASVVQPGGPANGPGADQWTEEEVWAWLSKFPFVSKLKYEEWEYTDGATLLGLSNAMLKEMQVPIALIPRLLKEIRCLSQP